MDRKRALILAVTDVVVLAELCAAIWWAQLVPEEISWRFVQIFLPGVLVTVWLARRALGRWAPKQHSSGPSPYRRVALFGAVENPKTTGSAEGRGRDGIRR